MTEDYSLIRNPEGVWHDPRDPRKGRHADAALVSVVIPCYKQAHFLGEAIESVLAQSYRRFEVIVVDDGSPDDTSEVAARYGHTGVRCVRQENRGISAARNAGFRESKGDYVLFLDADDRLLPEALEVGLGCLNAHPECAFASGRYVVIAADGSPLPTWEQPYVEEEHYLAMLRGNYIGMPAVVMHRRSVLDSVGGFDTSINAFEEYDLYLRVMRRFPVYCHGKAVAEYRQHDASASRNSALLLRSATTVCRSQRKHVKGNKRHEEAIEEGVRVSQEYYGGRLVSEVRTYVQEREWKRALRGMLALLRYYPRGLTLLDERRMERHRLDQRLQRRKQELRARERRLEELEGTRESKSALAKERQEVQRLRRRTRRLEQRIQNLDQRTLFKRLGRIRAGASKK